MEENKPVFGLQRNVAKAAAIRAMCQTEGYKIVTEQLETELKIVAKKIINVDTSDEEVLDLRKKAQVWVALQKLLGTLLLTGEISARNLKNLEVPSESKEG